MPGNASQRRLERLAALKVEVVGRLVEHEQVGAARDDEREGRAAAARRPRGRSTGFSCSSQPEKRKRPSSFCASGRRRPVAATAASSTEPRSSSSTLVLGEVGDLDAVAEPDPPRGGLEPPEHRLEQRRLARAVRADRAPRARRARARTTPPRAAASRRRAASRPSASITTRPSAPACRNSNPSVRRAAGARLDLGRRGAGRSRFCFDFACLRLGVLRAEPLDEPLELRDLLGVALRAPGRVDWALRRLLAPPEVPLAREEDRAAAVELEHRGRHRLEEPAVVRDEDHRRRRSSAAAPRATRSSRCRGGSSARRAAAGRAAQASARASEARVSSPPEKVESGRSRSLVGEAEPAYDGGGAVAPVVAARVLEPRLRRRVARDRPRVVRAGRHRALRARAARRSSATRSAVPASTYSRSGRSLAGRRPLVVQRDPGALLPGELAALERDLAGERAQQRRLAGAVRRRRARADRAARP